MADAALEALRRATPAARSLPLLAAVAGNRPETLCLDYVPGLRLELKLADAAAAAWSERGCAPRPAAAW
jgi:hypothetical protein